MTKELSLGQLLSPDYHLLLDMLNELTFSGVAITNGASGESLTANLSCINRLSTMESSLRTIL